MTRQQNLHLFQTYLLLNVLGALVLGYLAGYGKLVYGLISAAFWSLGYQQHMLQDASRSMGHRHVSVTYQQFANALYSLKINFKKLYLRLKSDSICKENLNATFIPFFSNKKPWSFFWRTLIKLISILKKTQSWLN